MVKVSSKHKMIKGISLKFIFALILFLSVGHAFALESESELFQKAYNYYISYKPDMALKHFELFLKDFPESSATDAVLFWKAKSLIQLKKFDDARNVMLSIYTRFPDSLYNSFVEKELETMSEAEKSDDVKLPLVSAENRVPVAEKEVNEYKQIINMLSEEKQQLERKLDDLSKKMQLHEKGLAKAIEDREGFELQLSTTKKRLDEISAKVTRAEVLEKENQKLSEERKILDARIKENEARINALNEEKLKAEQNVARVTQEISDLMMTKVKEAEKNWKELDQYIKQLQQEKSSLENQIQIKDRQIAESARVIDSLDSKIKAMEQVAEKSQKEINLIEELKKEKTVLEAKLSEEMKNIDELKRLNSQNDAKINELIAKEAERSMALAATEKERKRLEDEKRLLEVEINRLQKERLDLAKKIKENELDSKGINETITKIKNENIELKRLYEDAHNQAQEKTRELSVMDRKLKQYAKIKEIIKKKVSEPDVDEKDLRKYYEQNRDEFIEKREERFVKTLVIEFSKEDEIEKSLAAVELYKEALNGKTLESIHDSRPDITDIKTLSFNGLEEWLKKRLVSLKDGELSGIISTGRQLMIMRAFSVKTSYKKFEDVRDIIRNKIFSTRHMILNALLNEVEKETKEVK